MNSVEFKIPILQDEDTANKFYLLHLTFLL